jgi:acyl-CoA reductase-like NAD-dependent aldehyde dehydrogenase
VDPFVVIMVGVVGGLLVGLLLLGLFHPRTGADTLDWRPTRSAEQEIQNEIDDLDQMLEAANARRRRRGEPELTEAAIRASVSADVAENIKRREDHLADLEVVQMLDAKNARRRAKGLPEITVEEYRAKILGETRPARPAGPGE